MVYLLEVLRLFLYVAIRFLQFDFDCCLRYFIFFKLLTDPAKYVGNQEKLSVENFIDRSSEEASVAKPLPLESTPFKLVEGVKDLKEVAAKLRDAKEFAVSIT